MSRVVPLLDLDPELGEHLDEQSCQAARRHLVVRVERIEQGDHPLPAGLFNAEGGIGLLILEGLTLRRVGLAHRVAGELLGPGDLLRPWQDDGAHEAYPFDASWRVIQALDVAVLDAALTQRLAHFAPVVSELVGRALLRSRRTIGGLATAQLTSVDQRLLVSLWHLADRWGRVRPDGIVLPLPLTHEALGLLVGARRPSVTAALGRLAQRRVVIPQSDTGWLLCGDAPDELRPLPRRARQAAPPEEDAATVADG